MTDGNRNNKIITMMKEMYNLPPVDLLCKSEDAGVTSLNVEEMEYTLIPQHLSKKII